MFNSDLTANRPAAGIVGRIFIATDSPYGIFRDTGTAWDQISSTGGGATIYSGDGTLSANRTVASGGFSLTINPSTTFATTLTAAIGSGAVSAFGVNTLSYAAAFSSSNLGSIYGAIGGFNLQTFAGSATFAEANIAAANTSINSVDFSSGGSTITMTQASGLRVMAGNINMFQYQGTNSGTITHAAVAQNLGFYRPSAATGILTISNAYGFLLNDLNDYGAVFTFTKRWGIYQAGVSDNNYFAANVLIGSTTNLTQKLQVTGDAFIKGSGATSATSALLVQNSAGTAYFRLINDGRIQIGSDAHNTIIFPFSTTDTPSLTSRNLQLYSTNGTQVASEGRLKLNGTAFVQTSGIVINLKSSSFFEPTSGTATFQELNLSPQISQSGGANGITRGLYINPILSAVADWRALEISAGVSVLAPSTTASATLRIPSGTAPTTPTNGDIWFDGTNLFMRIGGTTKTFTII